MGIGVKNIFMYFLKVLKKHVFMYVILCILFFVMFFLFFNVFCAF